MTVTKGQIEGRLEFVIRCDPIGLGITNSYMALGLQRCDPMIPAAPSIRFSRGYRP